MAGEDAHSGEALICLLLDSMVVLRANRKLASRRGVAPNSDKPKPATSFVFPAELPGLPLKAFTSLWVTVHPIFAECSEFAAEVSLAVVGGGTAESRSLLSGLKH
jgi:hypothetical protein